jgi:hypothetical protein
VQKISFSRANLNFPSTKKSAFQVQKISFSSVNLNFPSTKNSFSSANISFPSAKKSTFKVQKNQLPKCKPLQANRPLEPLDMREPCPIFFTRGESGLEPHSP